MEHKWIESLGEMQNINAGCESNTLFDASLTELLPCLKC